MTSEEKDAKIDELEAEVARLAGALEWYAPRVPYGGSSHYRMKTKEATK